MLYAGSVDQMNATHRFFEVAANDSKKLKETLNVQTYIEHFKIDDNGTYRAFQIKILWLMNSIKLLLKSYYFHHIVKRKETLEEQFLELTKS